MEPETILATTYVMSTIPYTIDFKATFFLKTNASTFDNQSTLNSKKLVR